jgi:hypothetical protein
LVRQALFQNAVAVVALRHSRERGLCFHPSDPIPEDAERGVVKYREVAFVRGAIQPPAEVAHPLNPKTRYRQPYPNMQEPMPLAAPAPKDE